MTVYDHERSRWVTVFQELDRIRSFATADPRDEAGDAAASEFVNAVTTAMASSTSASKPPRAPLVKRKSQKSEDPAIAVIDPHVIASEQPTAAMLADAKQPRRRQDSILPLSFSPDSAKALAPPRAQLQFGGARSPFGRSDPALTNGGGSGDNNYSSSTSAGANETPLTTRSDAPYRSVRRHQLGPRAQDRGDSFGSDDDDDGDADSDDNDNDQDGNNDDDKTSAAGAQSSRSTMRQRLQRSASTKSETSSINQPRRKLGGLLSKGPTPTSPTRPVLPELPTQHIHLTMPNIYLSPDLTQSQATERAARRRIRKSAKLAQRLRRITF